MKKSNWRMATEVGVIGLLCALAVAIVVNGELIAKDGKASPVKDPKAWTVQDQDDADAALRNVLAPGTTVNLNELAENLEVLEREDGERIRAACPNMDCSASPLSLAER